ncbi:MAG: metallophosphoesterase family protein [Clostridia bacterium]|nr:metallophosphoesterase family protein [Clostridia bacterium]
MKVLRVLGIAAAIFLTVAVFTVVYVFWDSERVVVSEYTIINERLPASFNGFTIAFISDSHDRADVEKIVSITESIEPDLILLGGDMINMDTTDYANFECLCTKLRALCDVYYAYGNHELWSIDGEQITAGDVARKALVNVLNDETAEIVRGEDRIVVAGYRDLQYSDFTMTQQFYKMEEKLEKLQKACGDDFTVLLFHRANYFDTVAKYAFDVVLAGHTHGGYINLPKIRDYILMQHIGNTKYVRGEYAAGSSIMLVSGGLGQDDAFPRVFNTPEILKVVLRGE